MFVLLVAAFARQAHGIHLFLAGVVKSGSGRGAKAPCLNSVEHPVQPVLPSVRYSHWQWLLSTVGQL